MKKGIWALVLCLGLLGKGIVTQAEEVQNEPDYDPDYSMVSTEVNAEGEEVKTIIDFSEAVFTDEFGLKVPNEKAVADMKTQKTVSARGGNVSGGSWTSGSGYRNCKGALVYVSGGYYIGFKADFSIVQNGYDQLLRVYGVDISVRNGSFSIQSQGVFRKNETFQYSAYGGVKASVTINGNTDTTWVYLRVRNDKYSVDTNF